MESSDLRRASTTVVPPVEAPPPFSRASTATDSVNAADGHSAASQSEASDVSSSVSQAATPGELELETRLREKQALLDQARAERREIERRLEELDRLREEVGKKVELAIIARKVMGTGDDDDEPSASKDGITPSEIATYWDSLAEDIQGLDMRVKLQLGIHDDRAEDAEHAAGSNKGQANGVNGASVEEQEEEGEERKTPPTMRRSDTA